MGSSLRILTVQADRTFVIERYAEAGAGPTAPKILTSIDPVTGKRTIYCVEYRRGSGFDSAAVTFVITRPNGTRVSAAATTAARWRLPISAAPI